MERPLILVIEDERQMANNIAEIIKGTQRYEAVVACDAPEGFTQLDKHKPLFGANKIKCIVLDIKMPEIDGLEFLKELRQNESYTQLMPVIILSAYEDREKWTKATSPVSGMIFAYLKKPINEEELIATIDKCVFSNDPGSMIDKTRATKHTKLEGFKKNEEKKP